VSLIDDIRKLSAHQHRLMGAGDLSGAKRVGAQVARLQDTCNHRRTHTQAASKDSIDGSIKKGDLFSWCKDCLKPLKTGPA
jgi:hypothetical protein